MKKSEKLSVNEVLALAFLFLATAIVFYNYYENQTMAAMYTYGFTFCNIVSIIMGIIAVLMGLAFLKIQDHKLIFFGALLIIFTFVWPAIILGFIALFFSYRSIGDKP